MYSSGALYRGSLLLASLLTACSRGGDTVTGPSDTSPGPAAAPSTATGTYYVAIREAGADNTRCSGRSPVDRGNGDCPFRDFASGRPQSLLVNARGARVEVRAGTYVMPQGLTVEGAGTDDSQRIVLTNYAGEEAVLDGGGASREAVRVSGAYVTVQGLTIQNSGGYNLEVRGGRQVLITGNRFLRNRASDSLKGSAGAADVVVQGNQFSQWDSQAIDMTDVRRWTIRNNRFFSPGAADANAIGVKFGSRDVLIADNTFTGTRGLSLGGTSSAHANAFEAFSVTVQGNTFENIPLWAITAYSCSGCKVQGNTIRSAEGGIRLASPATMGTSGCPGGCRPTQDFVVSGNRFRNMTGNASGPPDTFWAAEAGETTGLSPSGNTYCESRAGAARFWHAGTFLPFSSWTSLFSSDTSSTVATFADPACAGV